MDELISVSEAARIRGVTRVTIYSLIRRGRLRSERRGARHYVYKTDVITFVKQKRPRDPSNWRTTTCPTCHKRFDFQRSWPRKYCSRVCQGKHTVSNIKHFTPTAFETPCEQCGKTFKTTPKQTRGRFCSLKCYGLWQSANVRGDAHPRKGKTQGRPPSAGPVVSKTCEVCGKEFITKASHLKKRRSCSKKCFGQLRSAAISGPNNFNWKGGYQPYYGPTWQKARRAARKRDGVCVDCGKTPEENRKALDVHHIVPFREFGVERHEEANDLANLVALCPRCHKLREPPMESHPQG